MCTSAGKSSSTCSQRTERKPGGSSSSFDGKRFLRVQYLYIDDKALGSSSGRFFFEHVNEAGRAVDMTPLDLDTEDTDD